MTPLRLLPVRLEDLSDFDFVAAPFVGELGWELINWAPWLRYRAAGRRIAVFARQGREQIYRDFAARVCAFVGRDDRTEGNGFIPNSQEAEAELSLLRAQIARHVRPGRLLTLPEDMKLFDYFPAPQRRYVRLDPSAAALERWRRTLLPGSVVFHVRDLVRMPRKNTAQENYDALADWCGQQRVPFVTVGRRDGDPSLRLRGSFNFVDATTLDDLAAIFRLASVVVGASSGSMHMAALVGAPHVVWGGGLERGAWIEKRYLHSWNPLNTPVEFLCRNWRADPQSLIAAVGRRLSLKGEHECRA